MTATVHECWGEWWWLSVCWCWHTGHGCINKMVRCIVIPLAIYSRKVNMRSYKSGMLLVSSWKRIAVFIIIMIFFILKSCLNTQCFPLAINLSFQTWKGWPHTIRGEYHRWLSVILFIFSTDEVSLIEVNTKGYGNITVHQ